MRRLSLSLLLIAACASGPLRTGDPKPGWVAQATSDARYPADKFVAAVGTTSVGQKGAPELLAGLDAAARASVAATLQSTLSSEVKSFESVQTVNGRTSEQLSAEQRVSQVVKDFDLIAAIDIADRWREGDTAYALAVLDKAKALTLQQSKVADRARLAAELLAQGDAAQDKPGEQLKLYARARTESEAALGGVLLLRALGGKAELSQAAGQAEAKMSAVLGKLVLSVVEGDKQRAAAGKALAAPVVFAAAIDGKPAVGLPLAIRLEGGRAQRSVVVGPDGRAAVRVDDIGAFAKAEQQIAASVDWPSLLGTSEAPAWTSAAAASRAQAVALKKSVETTRVLVLVQEKIEGGSAVTEPPVQVAITRALQRAGFDVQNPKLLLDQVGDLASLSDAKLKAAARGLAEIVVVGTATGREAGKFGATSVWARARGDLRAVDVNSGQVLWQAPADEPRGARPGELNVAGRAALEALGQALSPGVEKTLREAAAQ